MKEFYTSADLEDWDEPTIRLGVVGHPVAHSRSPQMMNAALEHCSFEMRYARFEVGPDELERVLHLFAERNFVGVNLTIPHKHAAASLMDELDDFARAARAVNCVRFDRGKLIGFNTDGSGFGRAIRSEFSVDLRDLRVLLIGAGGGAGRAIALQCAREGCERLVLANRTHAKAVELARELRPYCLTEVAEWNEAELRIQLAQIDLVVNATPLGMRRSDPPVLASAMLGSHLLVYDTIYEPPRTPLLTAATDVGAQAANGRSMLLHQGALSFERWFERDAPLAAMRAAL
ncbi:MAG: shikimate dehydrogenase, partial [Verrucomicrobiota bacterium]|nr:shikimate dehydrogenase [Verrucomicrobiota bacterium]